MKWTMQLIVLALVMAAGTWFAGWWFVPLAAGIFGAWAVTQRSAAMSAALAAALAWGALLAYDASQGPMGRLMELFHGMFRVSGVSMAMMTVAYAALLGAAAAALTRTLRRLGMPA